MEEYSLFRKLILCRDNNRLLEIVVDGANADTPPPPRCVVAFRRSGSITMMAIRPDQPKGIRLPRLVVVQVLLLLLLLRRCLVAVVDRVVGGCVCLFSIATWATKRAVSATSKD